MRHLKDLLDSHRLQSISLLRGVELESIQALLEECPIQEFKKDDVLIKAGKPNRSVYLLLSGRLSIHLKKIRWGQVSYWALERSSAKCRSLTVS
ncbi:MAG: hypothetical protein IH790_10750 [Acidobacteria bacterium]|nr:hypothetical protein [Acidobacteriota bacterium]